MTRLAAAVLTLAVGACSAEPAPFPAAPALPEEVRPLPPVSASPLIWQPGDWVYAGGSYRYEAGRYVPGTGQPQAWQSGHWTGTRQAPVWLPGGWVN